MFSWSSHLSPRITSHWSASVCHHNDVCELLPCGILDIGIFRRRQFNGQVQILLVPHSKCTSNFCKGKQLSQKNSSSVLLKRTNTFFAAACEIFSDSLSIKLRTFCCLCLNSIQDGPCFQWFFKQFGTSVLAVSLTHHWPVSMLVGLPKIFPCQKFVFFVFC